MVPFAGYLLPVQYGTGVIQEHMAVRQQAGLFDVSHMGELILRGKDALNSLTELVEQVDAMEDVKEMALAYHDQIVPAMAALRKPVDEMELLVDKSIWPVPTYGDLMFEV